MKKSKRRKQRKRRKKKRKKKSSESKRKIVLVAELKLSKLAKIWSKPALRSRRKKSRLKICPSLE
jgi:hypothetical protein